MSTAAVQEPQRKKLPETMRAQMGDRVFWFSQGELTNPYPAIANLDEQSRVLSLTVFTESGTSVHRSVRHYSVPSTQRDKERNGVWAFNRKPEPIPAE